MKKKYADRVMDIGDGLASFTHKKVSSLLKDLAKEGVLTSKQEAKIEKRLDGAKNNIYDAVSKELRGLADDLFEDEKKKSPAKKTKKGGGKKTSGKRRTTKKKK